MPANVMAVMAVMAKNLYQILSHANPSLSQRSSHHFRVTRLPNHMWANSWETTVATLCWLEEEEVLESYRRLTSL